MEKLVSDDFWPAYAALADLIGIPGTAENRGHILFHVQRLRLRGGGLAFAWAEWVEFLPNLYRLRVYSVAHGRDFYVLCVEEGYDVEASGVMHDMLAEGCGG